MKCLSVRQPWAWAIIYGGKDIENRTWATSYRGPLLIHASKTMSNEDCQEYFELAWDIPGAHIPAPCVLLRGGIIGRANLVDCVTRSPSPWFVGPYGFVLDCPEPLPFRPMRGRLGLFEAGL